MTKRAHNEKPTFFPYGTQYYRAPTPLPGEWRKDLKEIARAGYTHIQLRPQWRWHERIRGKIEWHDLDCLFDLASEHKLKVILKPMLETAPDWVFQKLGGTRIGFHGIPIDPIANAAYYVGGWWPCFDNPKVMAAAKQFVGKMVKRYVRHPALWFYDAWNEPVSRPLGQCHCIHSIKSYRQWLQERYGTIEKLNHWLGKAWTSYANVMPPATGSDYAEMFLWRQWAAYAIAQQVGGVIAAIRQADPKAFVMVHVGGSCVVQDPICNTTDDLLNSAKVDLYGTSFSIPLHPETPGDHAAPDYQSDWLRRIDPQYWCHEFYPNRANWCHPPSPATLRRLIWMAIAGGAHGFTFWQYRSERFGTESNGYGMREVDGSPTPRSRVCDEIGGILQKHGARLVGTDRERSPIALLYSRESDLVLRIQEMSAGAFAIEHEVGKVDYSYKKALKSAHALYLGSGQTVDWVIPTDDFKRYKLIHITCAEIIDEQCGNRLREYVAAGGTLVVEFPFACRDRNTWIAPARPAHGLADLVGGVEANRLIIENGRQEPVRLPGGLRMQGAGWRIDLTPDKGIPIGWWQDGKVAALRNKYGKGLVYAFGSNISLACVNKWNDPAFRVFGWILKEAGFDLAPVHQRRLWIRKRKGKHNEVWFVFNVSDRQCGRILPMQPKTVWDCCGGYVKGKRLLLEPGGVCVIEFCPA